jgi:putative Mg2+ transporter-C (MgtC) family protein
MMRFAAHGGTVVRVDPFRLFEAILMAVAFLGAGTIIRRREGNTVEGLTTAGSILISALVGIAVALNQYLVAVGVTVLMLLVLRVLRRFEGLIRPK